MNLDFIVTTNKGREVGRNNTQLPTTPGAHQNHNHTAHIVPSTLDAIFSSYLDIGGLLYRENPLLMSDLHNAPLDIQLPQCTPLATMHPLKRQW